MRKLLFMTALKLSLPILVFFFAGCTNGTIHPERTVSNNIFYSSDKPNLKIIINDDFKYIGVDKKNTSSGFSESHYFIKCDDNFRITKGVTIITQKLFNSSFSNDLIKDFKDRFKSGILKINETFYQYVATGTVLNGKFYADKGYIPSEKVFLLAFMRNIGPNSDVNLAITYYESVDEFEKKVQEKYKKEEPTFEDLMGFRRGWNTPQAVADALNAKRHEEIASDFLERAKASMLILREGS